ncbi:MAG: glycosyltransferase family 9 protein [Candidatus Obscuribacterales bacterium]|jgi:ADP-heptose:LPS heptosyltransferase|nr:glycosyltransferase family 9 protein [Candidatus Obscuribacterales bacterium]
MKLLAINFGGLGDEVLFLPTLKSIKLAKPTWQITLLTEPRGRAIKQLSRVIDENIVFDIKKQLKPKDYIDLISLIRKGKYDVVLSSGGSSRVSVLLFLTGIPKRIGYDSGSLSRLLLTDPVPLKRDQYAAWMYHDLVSGLSIDLPPALPQIDLEDENLDKMRALLTQERGDSSAPVVLIHPGMSQLALSKGIIKTWSSSNWGELIGRLIQEGIDVLLCGGPDDSDTISNIISYIEAGKMPALPGSDQAPHAGSSALAGSDQASHAGSSALAGAQKAQAQANDGSWQQAKGKLINAVGKTASIQDLAALMRLSDLVACVDSAPMHMALALNCRIVALFGPTDPAKLFVESDKAIALRDPNAELVDHNFQLSTTAQLEPSVQIPLDTVFQTVMDQLSRVSNQGS